MYGIKDGQASRGKNLTSDVEGGRDEDGQKQQVVKVRERFDVSQSGF
jgi:hypothetical protein